MGSFSVSSTATYAASANSHQPRDTTGLRDPDGLRTVAREFLDSRALLYLAGLLALLIGLAIVNTHNRWTLGWPLIITLYGWLALLGGILRLGFRNQVRRLGEAMLARPAALRIAGAIQLALGAFPTVKGYL